MADRAGRLPGFLQTVTTVSTLVARARVSKPMLYVSQGQKYRIPVTRVEMAYPYIYIVIHVPESLVSKQIYLVSLSGIRNPMCPSKYKRRGMT